MKALLFLGIFAPTITALAQDPVKFRILYRPNKIYTATINTSSISELGFAGNQLTLKKIGIAGLPLLLRDIRTVTSITQTGNVNSKGKFPATMGLSYTVSATDLNGVEIIREIPVPRTVVEGICNAQGWVRVDTVMSDRDDDSWRKALKTALEAPERKMQFPKNPLHMGESFEQQVPLKIVLPGVKPVNLLVHITYTWKKMAKGRARFDIVQKVSVDSNQANVEAEGGGSGFAEYDMVDETIISYDSTLLVKMKINLGDAVLFWNVFFRSNQIVEVE